MNEIRSSGVAAERIRLVRYAITGVASNALLYSLYIVITYLGMEPKVAVTCVFAIGVMQTFQLNRTWTFRFGGASAPAFVKYVFLYIAGYVANLLLLVVFVDWYGLPHQLVQVVAVVVVAAALFLGQRFWVFSVEQGVDPK